MVMVMVMVMVMMMMMMMTMDVVEADHEAEWREELTSVLSNVPQSVLVVMRYLFAFLNQ